MSKIQTGSQLQIWRKENHLTQKQLAELTNYSTDRISKIESQNIPIPSKLLNHIDELNILYHPPAKEPTPLAKQWEALEPLQNLFPKEFEALEKELIELLSLKINIQRLSLTESYLSFISLSLKNLILIANAQYINEEHYKKEILPLLQQINKEARAYLKKID